MRERLAADAVADVLWGRTYRIFVMIISRRFFSPCEASAVILAFFSDKRLSILYFGMDSLWGLRLYRSFHGVENSGDLRGRGTIQLAHDEDGEAGEEEAGEDLVKSQSAACFQRRTVMLPVMIPLRCCFWWPDARRERPKGRPEGRAEPAQA